MKDNDYTFYIRLTCDDVEEAIRDFIESKYPDYTLSPPKDWETEVNEGLRHTIPVLLPVLARDE